MVQQEEDLLQLDYPKALLIIASQFYDTMTCKVIPRLEELQQEVGEICCMPLMEEDHPDLIRMFGSMESFLPGFISGEAQVTACIKQLQKVQFSLIQPSALLKAFTEDMQAFNSLQQLCCDFNLDKDIIGKATEKLLENAGIACHSVDKLLPLLFDDQARQLLLALCPNTFWLYRVLVAAFLPYGDSAKQNLSRFSINETYLILKNIEQSINAKKSKLGKISPVEPNTWPIPFVTCGLFEGWILINNWKVNGLPSSEGEAQLIPNPISVLSNSFHFLRNTTALAFGTVDEAVKLAPEGQNKSDFSLQSLTRLDELFEDTYESIRKYDLPGFVRLRESLHEHPKLLKLCADIEQDLYDIQEYLASFRMFLSCKIVTSE
jgi:hypothetical protein